MTVVLVALLAPDRHPRLLVCTAGMVTPLLGIVSAFTLGGGLLHRCLRTGAAGPRRVGPGVDVLVGGFGVVCDDETASNLTPVPIDLGFAGIVEDGELGERLLRAIGGRGAFRAFRLILHDHPQTQDTWRIFAEERQRGRAREWLATHGYRSARPADK